MVVFFLAFRVQVPQGAMFVKFGVLDQDARLLGWVVSFLLNLIESLWVLLIAMQWSAVKITHSYARALWSIYAKPSRWLKLRMIAFFPVLVLSALLKSASLLLSLSVSLLVFVHGAMLRPVILLGRLLAKILDAPVRLLERQRLHLMANVAVCASLFFYLSSIHLLSTLWIGITVGATLCVMSFLCQRLYRTSKSSRQMVRWAHVAGALLASVCLLSTPFTWPLMHLGVAQPYVPLVAALGVFLIVTALGLMISSSAKQRQKQSFWYSIVRLGLTEKGGREPAAAPAQARHLAAVDQDETAFTSRTFRRGRGGARWRRQQRRVGTSDSQLVPGQRQAGVRGAVSAVGDGATSSDSQVRGASFGVVRVRERSVEASYFASRASSHAAKGRALGAQGAALGSPPAPPSTVSHHVSDRGRVVGSVAYVGQYGSYTPNPEESGFI